MRRPETFDFLGFTHRCDVNSHGYFTIRRETIAKRMRTTLAAIKVELIGPLLIRVCPTPAVMTAMPLSFSGP